MRLQSVDKLGLYALEEINKKRDTSNRVYSALHFETNAFSRAFAKNSTTVPLYGDARFSQKIPSFRCLCQTVYFFYSVKTHLTVRLFFVKTPYISYSFP